MNKDNKESLFIKNVNKNFIENNTVYKTDFNIKINNDDEQESSKISENEMNDTDSKKSKGKSKDETNEDKNDSNNSSIKSKKINSHIPQLFINIYKYHNIKTTDLLSSDSNTVSSTYCISK